MSDLQRIVEWQPAWDRRDPDPKKNYGIHGMELCFVLKGSKGATQFLIFTNWLLPSLRDMQKKGWPMPLREPMPADVGYHARVPQHEGQNSVTESCIYLDGAPCYYDGSGLQAQALFDEFVAKGEDVIWETLEAHYNALKGV